jgi:L-lysine exporter family protein LysE/ArgO
VIDASLDGLLTGLTLIVAIGAQNAYVLRQGLRRSFVGPVVAVCTVSDFALISPGWPGSA